MSTLLSSFAIESHNLTVAYQRNVVLSDVSYHIPQQTLTGIIGPNGSGKTTMLKAIMGLLKSKSGKINITPSLKVSYVPQRSSVDWDFPATVLEIVLMGRMNGKNILRRNSAEDKKLALQCLEKVQMEGFLKRQISELSGGQQQRVFLARALAQEADLYLLDEPFAGVDIPTENTIVSLLKEMVQEGKTVVVVHHDLQTVKSYFDWLVMLNKELIAFGKTEEVFNTELLQLTYGKKMTMLGENSFILNG